jgi:hypothetical protein
MEFRKATYPGVSKTLLTTNYSYLWMKVSFAQKDYVENTSNGGRRIW